MKASIKVTNVALVVTLALVAGLGQRQAEANDFGLGNLLGGVGDTMGSIMGNVGIGAGVGAMIPNVLNSATSMVGGITRPVMGMLGSLGGGILNGNLGINGIGFGGNQGGGGAAAAAAADGGGGPFGGGGGAAAASSAVGNRFKRQSMFGDSAGGGAAAASAAGGAGGSMFGGMPGSGGAASAASAGGSGSGIGGFPGAGGAASAASAGGAGGPMFGGMPGSGGAASAASAGGSGSGFGGFPGAGGAASAASAGGSGPGFGGFPGAGGPMFGGMPGSGGAASAASAGGAGAGPMFGGMPGIGGGAAAASAAGGAGGPMFGGLPGAGGAASAASAGGASSAASAAGGGIGGGPFIDGGFGAGLGGSAAAAGGAAAAAGGGAAAAAGGGASAAAGGASAAAASGAGAGILPAYPPGFANPLLGRQVLATGAAINAQAEAANAGADMVAHGINNAQSAALASNAYRQAKLASARDRVNIAGTIQNTARISDAAIATHDAATKAEDSLLGSEIAVDSAGTVLDSDAAYIPPVTSSLLRSLPYGRIGIRNILPKPLTWPSTLLPDTWLNGAPINYLNVPLRMLPYGVGPGIRSPVWSAAGVGFGGAGFGAFSQGQPFWASNGRFANSLVFDPANAFYYGGNWLGGGNILPILANGQVEALDEVGIAHLINQQQLNGPGMAATYTGFGRTNPVPMLTGSVSDINLQPTTTIGTTYPIGSALVIEPRDSFFQDYVDSASSRQNFDERQQ